MTSSVSDPLLLALDFLGTWHNRPVNLDGAIQDLPTKGNEGITPEQFIQISQQVGFSTRIIERTLKKLNTTTLPAILMLEDGEALILLRLLDKQTAEVVPLDTHECL